MNHPWNPPDFDADLDKIDFVESKQKPPQYNGPVSEEMCRTTAVKILFDIINDAGVRAETRVDAIRELRAYLGDGGIEGISPKETPKKKAKSS